MSWTVEFHPLAFKDLQELDRSLQQSVLKAIRKKLIVDPQAFGEPLRKELFGLWKLRVGDVRVLFQMQKERVLVYIVKIGMRRDSQVYLDMLARLR